MPQFLSNRFVPQTGHAIGLAAMPQYGTCEFLSPISAVPQYGASEFMPQVSQLVLLEPAPQFVATDAYTDIDMNKTSTVQEDKTQSGEFYGDLASMVAAGDECPAQEVQYVDDSSEDPATQPAEPGEPETEPALEPVPVDPADVLDAVRRDGAVALASAPEELRGDKEFLLVAASCCTLEEALNHATDNLLIELYADHTFMLKAVHEIGSKMLKLASPELREDREFMLAAAACCPPREALQYASDKLLKELCGDHNFMLKAVQQVGCTVLAHASMELRGNRAFMLEAAAACRPPGEAFKFGSKKLLRELRADRNFMLKMVREVGVAELAKASAELRGDREFMVAAAACCTLPVALKHASKELCAALYNDRAFMLKAVQDLGATMLESASTELRSDLGFMLEVAAYCPPGEAMKHASEELRAELAEEDDEDMEPT